MCGVTATLGRHGLRKWLDDGWTHRMIAYVIVIITLSFVVQIIATVMIGRL